METSTQLANIIKFAAFIGLIVFTTIIVSLNFRVFRVIFKERATSFWWLFLILSIIPLLMLLSLFTLIFERKSPIKRVVAFKNGRPVLSISEVEYNQIEEISATEALIKYILNEKEPLSEKEDEAPVVKRKQIPITPQPLPTTSINFNQNEKE